MSVQPEYPNRKPRYIDAIRHGAFTMIAKTTKQESVIVIVTEASYLREGANEQ